MYVKEKIIYSNVWEDPELNRQALDIKPNDVVLSITSGGCNSLNLLLENPKKVISIDCNAAQLYLLELKIAAIKKLNYEDFRFFLGATFIGETDNRDGSERVALYEKIKDDLTSASRNFWDKNITSIENGIINCGAVEKFFAFYRRCLTLLYSSKKLEAFFKKENIEDQILEVSSLSKVRWKILNWFFLNKFIIGLVKGRHSLKYVKNKSLFRNLNKKLHLASLRLPLRNNYFISLILIGKFPSKDAMPPYLLEKNFLHLKKNIERLELFQGTLNDVKNKYGLKSIDKFNLSNIMEWLSEETFYSLLEDLIEISRPKAKFCYRYTLADAQKINSKINEKIIKDEELSKNLFKLDRSFMYESFHVYEVR